MGESSEGDDIHSGGRVLGDVARVDPAGDLQKDLPSGAADCYLYVAGDHVV
jgi:hypothetical protein